MLYIHLKEGVTCALNRMAHTKFALSRVRRAKSEPSSSVRLHTTEWMEVSLFGCIKSVQLLLLVAVG